MNRFLTAVILLLTAPRFAVSERPFVMPMAKFVRTTATNGNKVFASGQAIREASLSVLRPTVHGSETSRTQKRSLCGLAASSGVLNPRENKHYVLF